jgi:hypothetical protein
MLALNSAGGVLVMKKFVIIALVCCVVAGAGVFIYGGVQGWFSKVELTKTIGKSDPDAPQREKARREPTYEDPQVTMKNESAFRLESLKKAKFSELSEALRLWGAQDGVERKISWNVVLGGTAASQETGTRVRACRLARALAVGKPKGVKVPLSVNPEVVAPLLGCLKEKDAKLAGAAAIALGSIHLHNPVLKLEEKVQPVVKKMIESDDAKLAMAGVRAAVFFKDVSAAKSVLAAWERREEDKAFSKDCFTQLRVMLELHLKGKLKAPDSRPTSQEIAKAKQQSRELAAKFGNDISKWKTFWQKP